ncbi:UNVERIFIED_CONTAM: hypothetical protein K2H54_008931 [Gekko kuhli]
MSNPAFSSEGVVLDSLLALFTGLGDVRLRREEEEADCPFQHKLAGEGAIPILVREINEFSTLCRFSARQRCIPENARPRFKLQWHQDFRHVLSPGSPESSSIYSLWAHDSPAVSAGAPRKEVSHAAGVYG